MAPFLTADVAQSYPTGPSVEVRMELPGEGVTVLFGPSGSGKTTVLRVLAGLERPGRGRIQFDGVPWVDTAAGIFVPPHRRPVGLLFQDFALFPHLTVAGNLAFGLRDLTPAERRRRVGECAAWVGLAGLEERLPAHLSGGQQQRLALGRALVRRPRLLLLDEPLSALDGPAREELRRDLGRLLKDAGIPALLVTHDRDEALALGDRLLLMAGGRIRQEGSPAEVFSRPGDAELARVLGVGTVVKVRVLGPEHGLLRVRAGRAELLAPDPGGLGSEAYACIRGEGVALERAEPEGAATRNRLPARVAALERMDGLVRVHLECGFPLEALLSAWSCEDLALRPGDEVLALVKATAVHLVPAKEG
ncbi:MAG: molybdenum ABC transporter ATP-binding protein [Acidobacteria bacterium]|nr:molybdenum ABC transporter ATP-binding protein [Acidobacteriota bacterium]